MQDENQENKHDHTYCDVSKIFGHGSSSSMNQPVSRKRSISVLGPALTNELLGDDLDEAGLWKKLKESEDMREAMIATEVKMETKKPKYRSRRIMKFEKVTPFKKEDEKLDLKTTPKQEPRSSADLNFTSLDDDVKSIAMKYSPNVVKIEENHDENRNIVGEASPPLLNVPNLPSTMSSSLVESEDLLSSDEEDEEEEGYQFPNAFGSRRRAIKGPFNWRTANILNMSDVRPRHQGEKGLTIFYQQRVHVKAKMVTVLEDISNVPKEDEVAVQPHLFRIPMKQHQLHALQFMKWRESRTPSGGIICDEMGLGKTVQAISLIAAKLLSDRCLTFKPYQRADRELQFYGGTLIVCPATLIDQWILEFEKFIDDGFLRIHKFHGVNRVNDARELATNFDVVVTSYNTAVAEYKQCIYSPLFRIKWDRIFTDEAHIMRNSNTGTCTSVCALEASSYWAMTGTPVQNKQLDMYSLMKFIRCAPFDEMDIWRLFMETRRGTEPSDRLQALLSCLMLRRTKEELADAGIIERLKEKHFEVVRMKLSQEEQKVHEAFMNISKAMFIRFLEQKIEKNPELAFKYRYILQNSKIDKNKLHEKFVKIAGTKVIKHHHLLTILLRLRQICLHPTLIHGSLEQVTKEEEEESSEEEDPDFHNQTFDLMNGLKKLISLEDGEIDDTDLEFGEEAKRIRVLCKTNPVFCRDFRSTKIIKLMELLKQIVNDDSRDKVILVCSFVEFLNIIRDMLIEENIMYCEYNGKVNINDRNAIVEAFNNPTSNIRIMLLSLTAGGVGLNLTGANHMIILDLHWNPQWETQVQDRIHRFGQEKEVFIHKFVCDDSFETRVEDLQKKKLAVADRTLNGGKAMNNGLTIDDMAKLFGF